ncbi:UbiD family decarboxylase [Infirmifilum lucidum]|uniref:UbiD family decarboxylase n=1 Tax=Infirmifilum lucidum TaxID=2776706 RepID=A0A7L9FHX8_9CREN|nr:UbiD family decarboxylase [Infirmifilum lucidum]QOJ78514.1 UbiD family decarboxylase [Infirmifilum lucidum]
MNLRETVNVLRANNLVAEIDEPLSAHYEIPWLVSRLSEKSIKALLFSRIEGKEFPLVTNVYYGKSHVVFREDVDGLREKFRRLVSLLSGVPLDSASKLSKLASLALLSDVFPKVQESTKGFLQYTAFDINLLELPALRHHTLEEYPVIKNPVIILQDPRTKVSEVFSQPVQVVDEKALLVHVPRRTRAYSLIEEAARHGGSLSVAVAIGSPPHLQLAASINWVPWIDKYLLAGALAGTPLNLVRLENGIYAPAEAEIILAGELVPGDVRPEGKMLFEDMRLYGGSPMPVIRVKALLAKPSAFFYTSITSPVRSDIAELKRIEEKLVLELVQLHIPGVTWIKFLGIDAYRTLLVALEEPRQTSAFEIGSLLLSLNIAPYIDTVIVLKEGREIQGLEDDNLVKYLITSLRHDKILALSTPSPDDTLRSERNTRVIVDATNLDFKDYVKDYIEGIEEPEKLRELYEKISRELRDA